MSTHRERRARVNSDAIEAALLDRDEYQWILNESPTVDYVDYDTEMRTARDAVPYIVDGGVRHRDFYSCGCCSDLDQFDDAHGSDEGKRIMRERSTDEHTRLLSFLMGELGRKEGQQCNWIDLFSGLRGSRGALVQVWQRENEPEFFFEDLANVAQCAASIIELAELHAASLGQHAAERAWIAGQKDTLSYVIHTRQLLGGRAAFRFPLEACSSRDLTGRLCDDQKIALDLVLEVGALDSDADARFSKLVPDDKRRGYLKKLAVLIQLDQGASHVGPSQLVK